ncbi:GGDEF domain-containing protein [Deinococcus aquaticus]|uniref:GGDEF domain-containing protein n=1 Tax=Deinococcus aquaticus TaxID=328692 RepID=A0ABY7V477_9DEIO|nr:GGDEF domain-containing protein [Deinococcus aquaticus]WDA59895.1 GGDEF domain-containing protein [Deinococcus aquaticus]
MSVPAPSPLPAHWWGRGVVLVATICAATLGLLLTGHPEGAIWTGLLMRVLALGALALASVRVGGPPGTVFRRLLAAVGTYVAAEVVFVYATPALAVMTGVPTAADVLYLLFYPLLWWALRPLGGGRALPLVPKLNILATTLTIILPLYVLLARQVPGQQQLAWWTGVLYPALDAWILSTLLALLFSRRRLPLLAAPLVAGVVMIVAGDVAYVALSSREAYSPAHPVTVLWTAAMGAFGLSALRALPPTDRPDWNQPAWVPTLVQLGPYASLAVAALTWALISHGESVENGIFVGIMALTALLLIRQELLGVRQRRLTTRLRSTAQALQSSRQDLWRQLHTDDLTGLPNRRACLDRLDSWLAQNPARTDVGVLFLDLDGFKTVNDGYGHAAGDEVLRVTGHRLTGLAAQEPDLLPARLSGDEFALVFLGSPGRGEALAGQIAALIARPITLPDGQTLTTAGSVGQMHSRLLAGVTTSALLSGADHAMYRVKRDRKAQQVPERTPTLFD